MFNTPGLFKSTSLSNRKSESFKESLLLLLPFGVSHMPMYLLFIDSFALEFHSNGFWYEVHLKTIKLCTFFVSN